MQNSSQPGRKLKVDLEELAMAFEDASGEVSYYLDLETGEVVTVTEEVRAKLDEVYTRLDEAGSGEGESGLDFDEALAQMALPDWLNQVSQEAHQVDNEFDVRYLPLPLADSRKGYMDMEDFIETVRDQRLQARLQDAISGRGAFRRFRDVLARFPEVRERWFRFKESRLRERVVEWLDEVGVDPET